MKKYIFTVMSILTIAVANVYVSNSAQRTLQTELQLEEIEAAASSGEYWDRIFNAATSWIESKFCVSKYVTETYNCLDASRSVEVGLGINCGNFPISSINVGYNERTCRETGVDCRVDPNGLLSCIEIDCYGGTTKRN